MTKAARSLTDLQVKNLKPPASRIELSFGDGLYLVHAPTGVKSWAFRYRAFEKPKKLTLGRYMSPADMLPDVLAAPPKIGGPLSIAGARVLGQQARLALQQGVDPTHVLNGAGPKVKSREVVATFNDFLRLHVVPHNRPSSAKEAARLFDKKVRGSWAGRSIDSIKRADVVELVQSVKDAGTPVSANRVLALVRKFFNWCVEEELIEASPCTRVRAPTAEVSRDRFFSDQEIGVFWRASGSLPTPFRQWVRVLMLTGQRRGEISDLRWSQISETEHQFALPKASTKNNHHHVVHTSSAVEAELALLPRIAGEPDFVFTSGKLSADGALTTFSGFSKLKARMDALIAATLAADKLEVGLDPSTVKPFAPWRWHDLRRTMATGMQKLGVEQRVVEKAINHVSGSSSGIVGVYQVHEFMGERRVAFDRWAERVLALSKDQK
ncbi:tyrosine-type recombinase/integrase [Brevundimonas sp. TWP2-3-4b1]|uniref:tyrosine-type recombinase/integrase n=1 Tax=Brevundimonas sp. TWP2-3-4b1 TaxID=2804580 RepID=UPI003CEC3620